MREEGKWKDAAIERTQNYEFPRANRGRNNPGEKARYSDFLFFETILSARPGGLIGKHRYIYGVSQNVGAPTVI
jgi:hypothetical protein